MEQSSFTIKDIELLIALHHEGSLQDAARQLGCTPSALSHRVHDAETRLGIALVERRGHLRLTEQAQQLMPRAEHILKEVALLRRDVQADAVVRKVGVSTLVLQGAIESALADLFHRDHHYRYEIRTGHSGEITDWVEQGLIDAGIVRLERMRPGLQYELLSDDRLLAVSSSRFQSESYHSLVDWPWVLFSSNMGHGQAVARAIAESGMVIRSRITVDSLAMASALIHRSYVSVLPWSMIRQQIQRGDLQEVSVPEILWPSRRTVVLTQKSPPAWISTLIRFLQKTILDVNEVPDDQESP